MSALRFLVHLIASTLGVTVTAAALTFSTVLALHQIFPSIGSRTASWILTETPYFPIQILVGLAWGWQLGRRYGHKVMLWTWIVPAIIIALLILFAPFPPLIVLGVEITKTEHFFGWACLPQNHCFEQVAFTMPLYAAIAYSIGAFLARGLPLSKRVIKRF